MTGCEFYATSHTAPLPLARVPLFSQSARPFLAPTHNFSYIFSPKFFCLKFFNQTFIQKFLSSSFLSELFKKFYFLTHNFFIYILYKLFLLSNHIFIYYTFFPNFFAPTQKFHQKFFTSKPFYLKIFLNELFS